MKFLTKMGHPFARIILKVKAVKNPAPDPFKIEGEGKTEATVR
jgi:hypothetical protein